MDHPSCAGAAVPALPTLICGRGQRLATVPAVQRLAPIPAAHVSGNERTNEGRPESARPAVASTPADRSRRTCSSCSPPAAHVRLSRSSRPVPATPTPTTTAAPPVQHNGTLVRGEKAQSR
jgi:hypothetical protein